ncbi:hypothetical protein [Lacticaseibacillus zhaodongensis]|uniref:hypothetical protein n=1 Tax=Lacticaseibacillus zhaodongensis TaxID=2668065 RepID=UPI0012D3578F|nr:hypothetical protein [Lacticaseibacillus zhaodongensis]
MIRPISLEEVQSLLQHYSKRDRMYLDINQYSADLRGLFVHDKLVAAWTSWQVPLHPYLLAFAVVSASYISDFTLVGPEIIGDLMQAARQYRGLVFADYNPQTEFMDWLVKQGFSNARCRVSTSLNLKQLPLAVPGALTRGQLLTGTELQADAKLSVDFVRLTWQQFAYTRRDNPVIAFDPDTWTELALRGWEQAAPVVIVDDGAVQAYVLLRRDQQGELTLSWAWATDVHYMRELLPHVLQYAQEHTQVLHAQFSSTDVYERFVHNSYPFKDVPELAIYVRMNVAIGGGLNAH